MKKWINVTHDFGLPVVILTLNARDMISYRIRQTLTLNENDPVVLEQLITKIIEELRPELKGGSLIGMGMRGFFMYEFWYYHPDLPRKPLNAAVTEMPLIPPVNEPTSASVVILSRLHEEDSPDAFMERREEKPYEPIILRTSDEE